MSNQLGTLSVTHLGHLLHAAVEFLHVGAVLLSERLYLSIVRCHLILQSSFQSCELALPLSQCVLQLLFQLTNLHQLSLTRHQVLLAERIHTVCILTP